MYRIMVVEDSKPIMRNIISLIESIDSRLKIVETAYDGDEALEKLVKTNVDILFTDIKMPVMDGLTLINEAKKVNPSIKFVIISGYDDFEYAKQAIKLQITEYILKPVEREELKKVIYNIIASIENEKAKKSEIILSNLLKNKNSYLEDENDFYFKSYIITIIRAGLSKKEDIILDKMFIKNNLEKAGCNTDFMIVDTGFSCEIVCVFDITQHKSDDFFLHLVGFLDILCTNSKQVNIVVSSVLKDINKLYDQYNNLSNILSSLIIIGKSQIFREDSLIQYDLNNLNEEAMLLKNKFEFMIKNRQVSSFKIELEKYLNLWRKNTYPAIFVRRFLTIIIDELNKTYNETDLSMLIDISIKVDQVLYNCNSYEDVYNNVISYMDDLQVNSYDIFRKSPPKELLDSIVAYIKTNIYGNITMQDLSEKFNVSASYINRLMKLNYNVSPMDFYIKLKIEEAKNLIDSNRDMLIKDISDSLGFSDQHYFSKVFKTQAGLCPAEFRNLCQAK